MRLVQALAKSMEHDPTIAETINWENLSDASCVAAPLLKNLLFQDYGFTTTITTPCDATFAENFPVDFPKSFLSHRSRTEADSASG